MQDELQALRAADERLQQSRGESQVVVLALLAKRFRLAALVKVK